ncbi:MAG: phenylpyruvate tautomerase MIF-related protein [Pseudomonadota bacterium]
MPYLHIRTNRNLAPPEQTELLSGSSALVAEMLGKPERYVMVSVECGVPMSFSAEQTPCAYLELKSIGLPEAQTTELSARLSEHIAKQLELSAERIYIEFSDAARHMWGWKGGTF